MYTVPYHSLSRKWKTYAHPVSVFSPVEEVAYIHTSTIALIVPTRHDQALPVE